MTMKWKWTLSAALGVWSNEHDIYKLAVTTVVYEQLRVVKTVVRSMNNDSEHRKMVAKEKSWI